MAGPSSTVEQYSQDTVRFHLLIEDDSLHSHLCFLFSLYLADSEPLFHIFVTCTGLFCALFIVPGELICFRVSVLRLRTLFLPTSSQLAAVVR